MGKKMANVVWVMTGLAWLTLVIDMVGHLAFPKVFLTVLALLTGLFYLFIVMVGLMRFRVASIERRRKRYGIVLILEIGVLCRMVSLMIRQNQELVFSLILAFVLGLLGLAQLIILNENLFTTYFLSF